MSGMEAMLLDDSSSGEEEEKQEKKAPETSQNAKLKELYQQKMAAPRPAAPAAAPPVARPAPPVPQQQPQQRAISSSNYPDPTPVAQMQQRPPQPRPTYPAQQQQPYSYSQSKQPASYQQRQQPPMQQQQPPPQQRAVPPPVQRPVPAAAPQAQRPAVPNPQQQQRGRSYEEEQKRAKEKFLLFTRVLMKYLEQKDKNLHQRVKAIIQECALRNRRGERGYESLTLAMKQELRKVVPTDYWNRATEYLKKYLENKKGTTSTTPPSQPTQPAPRPVPTTTGQQPKPRPVPMPAPQPARPTLHSDFLQEIDHAVLVKTLPSVVPPTELQRAILDVPESLTEMSPQFPLDGWDQSNVVSTRHAWARVRLGEENATWFNEDHAEEDAALAALSEGAQIYLRQVLEKAIHCARQRQNIDGVRLWHQQMVPSSQERPLQVRLGCDTERQAARTLANSAMTVKRMEEALSRQTVPKNEQEVNDETMRNSSDMSDLSLRPALAKGIDMARSTAKRSLELSMRPPRNECPIGRLPEKARLELVDFQMGMQMVTKRAKHRASTAAIQF